MLLLLCLVEASSYAVNIGIATARGGRDTEAQIAKLIDSINAEESLTGLKKINLTLTYSLASDSVDLSSIARLLFNIENPVDVIIGELQSQVICLPIISMHFLSCVNQVIV